MVSDGMWLINLVIVTDVIIFDLRTIVHDPNNVYRGSLSEAVNKLSTRLVGPNALI